MNNKIIIYIIISILFSYIALAQENVHETLRKNEIFSKIDLEHKNTKKYFSDELTRQREQFLLEIDDRGAYYEREADKMFSTAFWKLGLVWGGVILFTVGLSNIMRLKTERTRFNKLQKYLLDGLVSELTKLAMVQKKDHNDINYTTNIDQTVLKDKVDDIVKEQDQNVSDQDKRVSIDIGDEIRI